jgi:hypothetical protein
MRNWMKIVGLGLLAVGLLLLPAPSGVQTPANGEGPCRTLKLEGSLTHADDPLNPDVFTGTLDSGALSCSGMPRNC